MRGLRAFLWPWAYLQVEAVLHDEPIAAELLEEVVMSARLRLAPEVGANLKWEFP